MEQGSKPIVSVITPFHNTREYLAECIESVLRQSYQNWEYILVDNRSTDGSSEIAAGYAGRFPGKFRLIRTPSFLSQVQNYNFALANISSAGKYCKIVQADDWIFPDCLRSMVGVAEAHPAVGIVAAYELEGDDVCLDGLPYPSAETPGRDICRLYFLKHKYLFGTPTSLLMRSDVIRSRNPFYEERYAPFEDGHACFDLLKTWNFGFVHQVLTYTRRQEGSIIAPLRSIGMVPFLHFSMLVAHGRDFLSPREYEQCLKRAEREYFVFLAKLACKSGLGECWDFHKRGLAAINYALNRRMLIKWLPRALIEKCWDLTWRWFDGCHPLMSVTSEK
ncbi:MAG TPA: glycosyltransferase family 2 protein [Verrucomicrobiae bacterium]|nr:glycosyltransferase family 2 protein [Verrucomicrobiae bacterium]